MDMRQTLDRLKQVGAKQIWVEDRCYAVPDDATHVLVRPERRGLFISFYVIEYLGDIKPRNSANKFFYRPNGAMQCRVDAQLRPDGWHYDIQWLTEQGA